MAITNIPEVWSPVVLEALRKTLVYNRMFNADYQGDVRFGNQVSILSLAPVTVNDYTRYDDITYQAPDDSAQILPIDQEAYYACTVDDLDSLQSNADLLGALARDAVYQMANKIDGYLAGLLNAGAGIVSGLGTSGTPLSISSDDVKALVLTIGRKLDEANVSRMGRAIAVPPWFVEKMVLAGIDIQSNNDEIVSNGYVGRMLGFDILMSNNAPVTTGKYSIIAGTNIGATMAMQLNRAETLRLPNTFADAIRGLACYGGKITRPATIAKAIVTEGAET